MSKTERLRRITSGALAALLEVDQKTVHNWVDSGRLSEPERTLAGHMRFDPRQVATDYKRAGVAIPEPFRAYLETAAPRAETRGAA